MTDEFACAHCGERHEGVPFSYGTPAPDYWSDQLASDPESMLSDDLCVIRGEHHFVRTRLVIPVHDAEQDFEWGIWASLSTASFARMIALWETPGRESEPSCFGWFSTELPIYPHSTINLKLQVHTAPLGYARTRSSSRPGIRSRWNSTRESRPPASTRSRRSSGNVRAEDSSPGRQTRRRTETTLPRMTAWSPSMGW